MLSRAPRGPLAALVERMWVGESGGGADVCERMIPTGGTHVVLRLCAEPVRLVGRDGVARTLAHAVIGGARVAHYMRDVSARTRGIGALLRPGAAAAVLGVPAAALAGHHVALDAVWPDAEQLRDELAAIAAPAAALDRFEALLARRLRAPAVDPLVAYLARALDAGSAVAPLVADTGYSHRAVLARFRDAVGLAPKQYARVRRVQRAIALRRPWAEVAARAGFSDQAHLTRELVAIAGVTPTEYRRLAPGGGSHVPLRSNSFKPAAARAGKVAP